MCSTYVLSLARLEHPAVTSSWALATYKRVGHLRSFLPLAASRHTSKQRANAACSCSSTAQFANGPKISMGHFLGAKNSFAVRRRPRPQGGRACLILSIPANQVSLGSPRVGTIHVQSPTPHAPPLQAFLVDFSQQATEEKQLFAMVCFQGSRRALGCRIDGVCGTGDYPPTDLPREASRSRSTPEKSVQFGPDGAPFPSKTSITRGPPVVAVAVSLDPTLPQR